MVDIKYIDDMQHELASDFKLLNKKQPFLITVDVTDQDDCEKLKNEVRGIVDSITKIENLDDQKLVLDMLLDSLSNQIGHDFKSMEDFDSFLLTNKDANEFRDKERSRAKDFSMDEMKPFEDSELKDSLS